MMINSQENQVIIVKNKKDRNKIVIFLWIVVFIAIIGSSTVLFLLYGPYKNFRNWLITSAMETMSHQYLATIFYSDEWINLSLEENKLIEPEQDTNSLLVERVSYDYTNIVYKDKYEKDLLTKDNDNDLYKLIPIRENKLRGYLVAIYDPSKVKLATAKHMGAYGQMLTDISKDNKALVAINASGFYDPNGKGCGGRPRGIVIKNGKLISNSKRSSKWGGGVIGFTNDDVLVLSRMSAKEAISAGIRDAVEFGPFLIVNGKASTIKNSTGGGTAPRTSIAQRKDGIVLFLCMDGRDYLAGVPGATMSDVIKILQRYGAYNASNLDGGTSTGLVINNEFANKPMNASSVNVSRLIPNAWILVGDN